MTIDQVVLTRDFESLEGSIESPAGGSKLPTFSIPLEGWALGTEKPVEAIEVSAQRGDLVLIPVDVERADISASGRFDVPWVGNCGFRFRMGALQLPPRFRIYLSAMFADGSRRDMAEITGRRRSLPRLPREARQPVLVTTVGRTGSTWLTWMLAQHPALISYKPWAYEPHIAIFFSDMLSALAQPSSYLQLVSGDVYGPEWWLGKERVFEDFEQDPEFERWLGSTYLEDLARLLMGRVEAIYGHVAELEGKPGASFFVEKHHPSSFLQEMIWDMFPGTREVFLIRDPRDLVCSILSYGKKRGAHSFGREYVATDEEFVRGPLRVMLTTLLHAWGRRSHSAFLVRYEDLIREPEETLEVLLSYLGVDRSPDVVESVIANSRGTTEEQEAHRTAPTIGASIGRWRSDLSPDLQRACQEALGDVMTGFGYAT